MGKNNIDFSKIYSYSKLSLFDQCPRAYYFFYVNEVYMKMKSQLKKDPENIWPFNTLGKAVHNAITLYFYLPKTEKTWLNLKEQLKICWRSEVMKQKMPPLGKWGGFASLQEERQYYLQAVKMLANFQRLFPQEVKIKFLPTDNIFNSIEDYQNLIKPLTEEYDISGKFDLILDLGSSLSVVDFKTSKNEEKDNFQLKFYKLLAELNFNQPVSRASFYYLRTGRVKEFILDNIDKEKIAEEVKEKIKLIKKEKDFKPQPSPLCRYCLFKHFCPAKKEVEKYLNQPVEEEIGDLPF